MRNLWRLCGMLVCMAGAPALAADELVPYKLGETELVIWVFTNGQGPIMFAPHDDENISATVGMLHVAKYGGKLVQLVHTGKRNISFRLQGEQYAFDPNRMFSDAGIEATLKAQGKRYSPEAHEAVKVFARTVLQRLVGGVPATVPVVALHNNTNGNYSLESYERGGEYAKEAAEVYRSGAMDPDDFFFVTTPQVFAALKAQDQNVVLQDNAAVTDDGSLSVRAARAQVPYINIEAQEDGAAGHESEQATMLRILQKVLQ